MFKFRFEVLRKVKRIRNDLAQQDFAAAQRAELELTNERTGCLDTIAHSGDSMLTLFEREVTSTDITTFYNYQHALLDHVHDLDRSIEDAAQEVERKREALLTARREYKAIERLKEIQLERHRIEEGRADIKVIDEIAVTRRRQP